MKKRYQELDSLRGIAALSVFIFHIIMVLPDSWMDDRVWSFLFFSPLHTFFSGEQPVILFFVLSGFVLSLIFFSEEKTSYLSFIIKRIVRLYIPYSVSIIFAMILFYFFSNDGIDTLGNLFNTVWQDSINTKLFIDHFLFLGNYNVYAFNIVIWTLIHEMRISFIIPFLVLLVNRFSWKVNLIFGICLAVIGSGMHLLFKEPFQPVYKTFFYVLMFIVGILLSKNRFYLIGLYNSFTNQSKFIISLVGIVLYIYADLLGNPLIVDWITTIGVSILLIVSISSQLASKILLWKPLLFLGKISYSLYLYHLPILLSLIYLLYGKLPLWGIIGLSIIITILISKLALSLIEKPSIKLATKISKVLTVKYSPSIVKNEKEII